MSTSQQDLFHSFSQRYGYTSLPNPLKPGEITPQLRNEFNAALMEAIEASAICNRRDEVCYQKFQVANWQKTLLKYWVTKFERQYNQYDFGLCLEYYCLPIINRGDFHEVFNLIEDLINLVGNQQPSFVNAISDVLSRNQAPYILRKNEAGKWWFIQTGNSEEGKAVIRAFEDATSKYIVGHLEKSGHAMITGDPLLATEEVIKALEACMRDISMLPNKTGVDALKKCASILNMPTHIFKMLENILNYRGDSPGIGHSMKNSNYPPPDRYEAQFIYVICCATISFLTNKSRNVGCVS